jgi:5-hmdU DNA kinase-like protein
MKQFRTVNILTKSSLPKPTAVYDTLWRFAVERQEIFFRRLWEAPAPWTNDPILAKHKFTNAYRAADRTSQYAIRNVIYRGEQKPDEVFFRCILFKIFNRVSTWELLEAAVGEIRHSTYSFSRYDEVLQQARRRSQRIFSAAYIMPSHATGFSDSSKHRNYLVLLDKMMKDEVPSRLVDLKTMASAFELLRSYPLIGNFLAYQFVTDINYSSVTNFSEMDFVVPGPGARDGIRKCFGTTGDLAEADIIRFVTERQDEEFARLGLTFRTLWGRPLQLIDCQNLFCEVGKYARLAHPEIRGISGRTRIKQKFTQNPQHIHYWFPPKWEINEGPEEGSTERDLSAKHEKRSIVVTQSRLF